MLKTIFPAPDRYNPTLFLLHSKSTSPTFLDRKSLLCSFFFFISFNNYYTVLHAVIAHYPLFNPRCRPLHIPSHLHHTAEHSTSPQASCRPPPPLSWPNLASGPWHVPPAAPTPPTHSSTHLFTITLLLLLLLPLSSLASRQHMRSFSAMATRCASRRTRPWAPPPSTPAKRSPSTP